MNAEELNISQCRPVSIYRVDHKVGRLGANKKLF
jgi:hypothetical protein